MSDRITDKDLESVCKQINLATGNATEPYTKNPDGTFTTNRGCHFIAGAYGGVNLHQLAPNGGCRQPINGGGYYTKRELYTAMRAYLAGIAKGYDTRKEEVQP